MHASSPRRLPGWCGRRAQAFALGLGLVVWALGARGAAPTSPTEKPVELPPFLVEEKNTVRPWVYVGTAGHEILSRCSDDLTTDFAARELRLEELLAAILPRRFQFRTAIPKPSILAPTDLVSASARDVVMQAGHGKDTRPGSWADNRSVRFLANLALDDSDMESLFAIFDERHDDAATIVYTRNRVQFLLRRRVPALPAWFVAGFLWLFDDLQFGRDRVTVNAVSWSSEKENYGLRTDPDYPRTLLAMRDVFAASLGDDRQVDPMVAKQAALLIRWCLQDPGRREALWRLLTAADTGPITEPVVQECFGCDLSDLRDRLSDYLPTAVRDSFDVKPAKLSPTPKFDVRTATPVEVGRILGDWERLEVRFVTARQPEFVPAYLALARKTLNDARRSAADDPDVCGIFGLLECDAKDDAAARVYLETAVAGHVMRPRVYVELARLRLAAALQHPDGSLGRLSIVQANSILDPLVAAYAQNPPVVEAYLVNAQVWLRTLSGIQPKNLSVLERGVRLFPADTRLLFATAILETAFGSRDLALQYLTRAEGLAANEAVRVRFREVRLAIEKSQGGPVDLSGQAEEK